MGPNPCLGDEMIGLGRREEARELSNQLEPTIIHGELHIGEVTRPNPNHRTRLRRRRRHTDHLSRRPVHFVLQFFRSKFGRKNETFFGRNNPKFIIITKGPLFIKSDIMFIKG